MQSGNNSAFSNVRSLVPEAAPDRRRRAELLLACASTLHAHLELRGVFAALAQHVRELLDCASTELLVKQGQEFHCVARAGAEGVGEGRIPERTIHDFAQTVVASSGTVMLPLRADGSLLGVGMRTHETQAVLVAASGATGAFTAEDSSLLAAVAGIGNLAISNAELYDTAQSRARELQQLLDISAELGTAGELDTFLERFVVRAAEFLGFSRALIGVCEDGACLVRWIADAGVSRPLHAPLPEVLAQRVISGLESFTCEDSSQLGTMDFSAFGFEPRQILAVPLLGADRQALGMLAVMERRGAGHHIVGEDVRRARALAAEAAIALEATRNAHLSRQYRRRSDSLMSAALELNSSLHLTQFVESFTRRAADMLDAPSAALAISQGARLEVAVLQQDGAATTPDNLWRRLSTSLGETLLRYRDPVLSGTAAELLDPDIAAVLQWNDIVLARLVGGDGELLGLLCLANRKQDLGQGDRVVLQALVGHAAVALENARLFTRMDQANRHWIQIFDAISDFIVVHDENQRVLRVNRSLADFIGARPHDLIGVTMRALVAMTADESSSQPCPFCSSREAVDEYIHPVLQHTFLISTSRVQSDSIESPQTIHVLKDITDRREAERRYRELFDTIQEGLFFSTPEGRFIEVNDALVRMIGYSDRDEVLQLDISHQLHLRPENRDRFLNEIEKNGGVRNFEQTLRRKDGSLIHVLENAFAVRDSQGRIVQYRGLMLDITEQKNFQAELQRQRDFNSKILNATQSMILVVDTAGLISYANRRCFEAGFYRQNELLGRRLVELVPPGRRELLDNALANTLAGEQVDNLELPVLLGQGRIGQFSINLSPMRDELGAVSSIVVVMTDITDAAMLQAKLMHTEKMAAVGQLVSGVAHEVNNPLTAILGFSDLLIESPDVPLPAKDQLQIIVQEAQRTKQIVQNLLSFARQMPPQRSAVEVNGILRRTLALRSYDFNNRGVQVVERLDEDIPFVMGDSHQLQQVFLNILNNAYDAVAENNRPGRIDVRTMVNESFVEINFRDNGPGITYPERIFDPFFTTKEVGKGTGLGLSICYGIVHEHGGEITCHNNVDGPGATFLVRLPVASTSALATAGGIA